MLNSLLENPSAIAALTSALVAATVALLVATVTQYLNFKKGRIDFLTPKLEQLYLLINELSEQNSTQFKQFYLALHGNVDARAAISAMDELDLYGHRRAKKFIMYISMYFPKLSRAHQMVFAAERELNDLKHDAQTIDPPTPEEILIASGRVGHFLMLMEQELIQNRDRLLNANFFPKPYRYVTAEEIEAERPPPTGAPFGSGPIRRTNLDTATDSD